LEGEMLIGVSLGDFGLEEFLPFKGA